MSVQSHRSRKFVRCYSIKFFSIVYVSALIRTVSFHLSDIVCLSCFIDILLHFFFIL